MTERTGGLEPRRGMALGALVLGILSFPLFCIGPLLSIPAIILGFVARGRASRDPQEYGGKGMALTGAIAGILNLVATPVLWLSMFPLLFIVAPGLNKAREKLMQLSDAASAKEIMTQVIAYSHDHHGEAPPHIAAIVGKLRSPSVLVSNRGKTTPMGSVPAGKRWEDIAADVEAHCDFAYVGAGMNLNKVPAPSDTIIVFTKLLPGQLGRTVGFADGHVEWVQEPQLGFMLRRTNEYRKTIGLGAVELDTMIPSAPVRIGPAPPKPAPRVAVAPEPVRVERPKTPENLPPLEPGGAGGPATRPAEQPVPVTPPVPDETLVPVRSLDAVLPAMRKGNAATKRSALTYLERTPPPADYAERKEVAMELEKFLADTHSRRSALMGLRKWSIKENAPAIVKAIETIEPDQSRFFAEINVALEALGNTGDAKVGAETAARMLGFGFNQTAAKRALVAMGSEVETAVHPFLEHKDTGAVRAACEVLAEVGTSKSIPELEKLLAHTNPFTRGESERAIKKIKEREGNK